MKVKNKIFNKIDFKFKICEKKIKNKIITYYWASTQYIVQ